MSSQRILEIEQEIFKANSTNFNDLVFEVFKFQYANVEIFQRFCNALGRSPSLVQNINQIPFIPVDFFKQHQVSTSDMFEVEFKSSGTNLGKQHRSSHFVFKKSLYENSIKQGFKFAFGDKKFRLFALLPNYLEQGDSSLVFMIDYLFNAGLVEDGGYFLQNHQALYKQIELAKNAGEEILLWGVTYALLDFAASYHVDLSHDIVLETGGMKGRGPELTREEVHARLTEHTGAKKIWSEYGMTELLSQAYSKGDGIFTTPPWMKILIADINDPLSILENDKSGTINVIDLANLYSCSFIATQDIGQKMSPNNFRVLGRTDGSETRGCNLLAIT